VNNSFCFSLNELSGESLRVAGFSRSIIQEGEPDLLGDYYEHFVSRYPNWIYVGCYRGREKPEKNELCLGGLPQILRDCESGEIDLILAKSPLNVARDIMELVSVIRTLKALSPLVGIFFVQLNMFSLHGDIEFALMAMHESECKTGFHGNAHMTPIQRFNVLKNARTKKGLTQQQVADIANINVRQYRRYENGERSIRNAALGVRAAIYNTLDIGPETPGHPPH